MEQGKRPKVFLADGDTFLLNIYKLKLSELGYEIETFDNGIELLDQIKKTKPDLLIVDMMLPKKDGLEVIKELKKAGNADKMGIMITSTFAQQEDIKNALQMGANDFLIKANLSTAELVDKAKNILG